MFGKMGRILRYQAMPIRHRRGGNQHVHVTRRPADSPQVGGGLTECLGCHVVKFEDDVDMVQNAPNPADSHAQDRRKARSRRIVRRD